MSRKKKSLEQLFDEMRQGNVRDVMVVERVLTHPDRDAHTIVRFLVSSSRCFEKDSSKWASERGFSSWWGPSCGISAGLTSNRRLLSQLSIDDTMKAISTMMGHCDEGLHRHLIKLLTQLPLREQFALFDRLIKLSRRWRMGRPVYQFALIYLIENFNTPMRKNGAKDLVKMATAILKKPYISNEYGWKYPSDEVFSAFRNATEILARK